MKKYYYHVSYFHKSRKDTLLGDVVIDTPAPIKTSETINRVREAVLLNNGGEGTVVILGFTLLRIEEAEA